MREIVLGTAGHVDHGKTSLVRALTGIDTDRLKEEKARGITIELGFAHLDLPCGHRLGIIDVPGHEKFVRNMVAGASGIDLVGFVIAADEGIMPQTREHLDICRVLGVRAGLVVLSKVDLVDAEWLAMVTEEVRSFQARVLRRLDNMAKSTFALIEPGSAFAGSLFEIALSCDRSYMLANEDGINKLVVGPVSGGAFPMHSGVTRLQQRYPRTPGRAAEILALGEPIDAESCEELGLVTMTPDEIDWDDEIRIALEERRSLSPDALTGMEQNLRFGGPESSDNKIYGRLTAWQNWIFQRPNAVGERGALKMFGAPERAVYDFRRT